MNRRRLWELLEYAASDDIIGVMGLIQQRLVDVIPIELLKLGGDSVVKAMHKIIVCVWNTGKWPEDWTIARYL